MYYLPPHGEQTETEKERKEREEAERQLCSELEVAEYLDAMERLESDD